MFGVKRGSREPEFVLAVLSWVEGSRLASKRRCAASVAFKAKKTPSLDVNATPKEADRSEKTGSRSVHARENELQ